MRKVLFGLRPADVVTILFLLFLTIITIIFYERLPKAFILISIYTSLIVSQAIVIIMQNRGRFFSLLYNIIFPVTCVLVVFDTLGELVHYVNPEDIDPMLIRFDYLIFDGHPTVMLEKITSPIFTELLTLAYTTYYFIPILFGVILWRNNQRKEFDRTLFLILLCFYLSYIGYILMPALGPRFTINHLQATELQGLFVAESIQKLLNKLEGIKRDAFPSGHTAIPLVILYLAYQFKRGLFWVFLPIVSVLIFSTVYCRYHYVVDVLAGFGLAIVTVSFGQILYDRWLKKQQRIEMIEKVQACNVD